MTSLVKIYVFVGEWVVIAIEELRCLDTLCGSYEGSRIFSVDVVRWLLWQSVRIDCSDVYELHFRSFGSRAILRVPSCCI